MELFSSATFLENIIFELSSAISPFEEKHYKTTIILLKAPPQYYLPVSLKAPHHLNPDRLKFHTYFLK